MTKKIALCFDGTSNQPSDAEQEDSRSGGIEDDGITNVLKLHLLLGGSLRERSGSGEQVSFYHPGVGTYGAKFRRIYNLAFSPARLDVGAIIRAAVADLQSVYEPGDEVFLFGFSRGAAIARRFASVMTDFFEPPVPAVRFVGVFDTVASFGIPNLDDDEKPVSDVIFEHGGTIAGHIDEALHILSLDDRRKAFLPTLMNRDPRVDEIWFPGVHSDVGGGFRLDGLSDLSLQYLLDEIERRGLGLRILAPSEVDLDAVLPPDTDYRIDLDDLLIEPNVFGLAHFQKRPWLTTRVTLTTREPRVNQEDQPTGDPPHVHWSVAERIYGDPEYRPKALSGLVHELIHPDGSTERIEGLSVHLRRGIRNLVSLAPGERREIVCRAHLKHNHSGIALEAGAKYVFEIPPGQHWNDASIQCGPEGWTRGDVQLGLREVAIAVGEWRRRKSDANWFALIGAIGPSEDELFELTAHQETPYEPKHTGELCTFANDMLSRYANNSGRMKFTVTRKA